MVGKQITLLFVVMYMPSVTLAKLKLRPVVVLFCFRYKTLNNCSEYIKLFLDNHAGPSCFSNIYFLIALCILLFTLSNMASYAPHSRQTRFTKQRTRMQVKETNQCVDVKRWFKIDRLCYSMYP